ncbi:hypothetical protein [Rubrobacter calidifluminis]|uniref:hypothetical protein n=1 Tax=Rubrobacter calidifluminis TaxID=1392640 RepID=UPI002361559D|nr:hypothetical protein [Rubrobacter calidifluminis]
MSEGSGRDSEKRRRLGPLGEEPDDAGKTRRSVPPQDPGATRRMEPEEWERPYRRPVTSSGSESETRMMRPTVGDTAEIPRPSPARGSYRLGLEEREERLKELYGGVDWLASFLGFVFCAVSGSVLSYIAGFVLRPLGFPANLSWPLNNTAVAGVVVVAVLIFLAFFSGGYVAGRLARFDGGINGAVILLWSVVLGFIAAAGGAFIPSGEGDALRGLLEGRLLPGLNELLGAGGPGIGAIVGAVVVALLGGFLGGRLGSRYHAEIDRTS